MVGGNVTEMVAELVVAKKLEATAHELIKAIHPHPTMSEAIMEAAAAAYGEVIHIWEDWNLESGILNFESWIIKSIYLLPIQ